MKEKIEEILNNIGTEELMANVYDPNSGYWVVDETDVHNAVKSLHSLFVQSQIDMLEEIKSMKRTMALSPSEFVFIDDIDHKLTSLKQLL